MNQSKIKLAVVDDDESFASALERRFRLLGLEVTTYPSAEAFLASTTLPRPDCLVLDIQLGGMSGLDLQRRLGELGARAPIIFVTAHDSPAMRKKRSKPVVRRSSSNPCPPSSSLRPSTRPSTQAPTIATWTPSRQPQPATRNHDGEDKHAPSPPTAESLASTVEEPQRNLPRRPGLV